MSAAAAAALTGIPAPSLSAGRLLTPAAVAGVARVPAASVAGSGTVYVTGPNDTGFQNYSGYSGNIAGSGLTNLASVSSNTTYTNRKLTTNYIGSPSAPVSNVVFNGCLWEMSGTNAPCVVICANGPVTFNYCTMRPTGLTDGTNRPDGVDGYQFGLVADGTPANPGTWNGFCKRLTMSHCDVWGFGNASLIQNIDGASTPHLFEYNWWHSARLNNNPEYDDHTDGPGCPGGGSTSYTTYNGNRIESEGDTNGLTYQTIPSGSLPGSTWSHMTVTNNLFGGFGNTVNISSGVAGNEQPGSYIIFEDNTFSTELDTFYSPLYDSVFASSAGGTNNSWRRNRWLVPPGAAWGTSGNSGKYWMPVDTNRNRTTGSDAPYVSTTDYTG